MDERERLEAEHKQGEWVYVSLQLQATLREVNFHVMSVL